MSIFLKDLYRHMLKTSLYDPIVTSSTTTTAYFVAGRIKEWDGGPFQPDEETGSPGQLLDTAQGMIAGVRVKPNDVSFVVPRNTWSSGIIYSPFNADEKPTPFFVVNSTNDLYKCIGNNNGAVSTEEPTSLNANGTFQTADGYVWKYYGTIDAGRLATFGSTSVIPLIDDANVVTNSVPGTIDVISVVSPGTGYIRYATGKVGAQVSNTMIRVDGIPDEGLGFYSNCSFSVTAGTGVGTQRVIVTSTSNSSGSFLTLDQNVTVDITSEFVLSPRLQIFGDGSDARAYVHVANGAITNVVVTSIGSNYSDATVVVQSDVGINAEFKAHISPSAGHGKDIVSEFESVSFSLVGEFTKDLDNYLPDDITYYQFALLLSPKNNAGTVLTANTVALQTRLAFNQNTVYNVGEQLRGSVSNAHGVVVSSNNTYTYVTSVRGAFETNEFVTGNVGNVTSQVSNVVSSEYDRNTGQLLYYTNVSAINRNDTIISEKIRCTIDFEG